MEFEKISLNAWEEIPGWLENFEGGLLTSLAEGKDCLEIGSYKGKSTIAMAASAKSVLAVDTFKADEGGQNQKRDFTSLDEFIFNIEKYDNIQYKIGKSEEIVPTIDGVFDLVFIDGWHSYEQLILEIELVWRLIKEDGIFVFHDAHLGGIIRAIAKFFDKSKLKGVQLTQWVYKKDGKLK